MEFQVKQNEQGIRNLYFGHPFSRETYTNSIMLRTPIPEWTAEFDGVYSGKHIELLPVTPFESTETEDEYRVVRGTKAIFIGDYEKIREMEQDVSIYHELVAKATVKVNNPEFLDFDVYTDRILHDPLKSIYDMTDITVDQAKKYMEYAVLYDKDKQYSDKLILKPYFVTMEEGILILSEDFADFNFNFKIDPGNGVVGCELWLSENTSKYTKHYKEI